MAKVTVDQGNAQAVFSYLPATITFPYHPPAGMLSVVFSYIRGYETDGTQGPFGVPVAGLKKSAKKLSETVDKKVLNC